MITIGPTAFAVITWGSIGLVGLVFLYEVYVVLVEYDVVSGV